MISIIICSRKPNIPDNLKYNIEETIGVDYELIVIDNSENKYSIFEAYNEGVRRAKYPYLCFMHEDILFHTNDWGQKVIEHLKDEKVGIIGVVGSHYVPKLPGAHWSTGVSSVNVIHNISNKIENAYYLYKTNTKECENAILLDGLWLCLRADIFKFIRFDDTNFNGFHCYDSDISLQSINKGFENKIVFDIKIEHTSLGKRDKKWIFSIFKLYEKWKSDLPLFAIELSKSEISKANYNNAFELKQQIKINKIGFKYYLKTTLLFLKINPLNNSLNIKLLIKFMSKKLYNMLAKINK